MRCADCAATYEAVQGRLTCIGGIQLVFVESDGALSSSQSSWLAPVPSVAAGAFDRPVEGPTQADPRYLIQPQPHVVRLAHMPRTQPLRGDYLSMSMAAAQLPHDTGPAVGIDRADS